VAKDRSHRIDPTWPAKSPDDHVVNELRADVAGSMSPFGDLEFPLPVEQLGYEHPVTEINK
jgi:hypothetical protein